MPSDYRDLSRVDEMLKAHEARALSWSIAARMLFFGLFAALVILHLIGLLRPGIVAESETNALWVLGIQLAVLGILCYLVRLARREQHLIYVGVGSVLIDILALSGVVILWAITIDTPDGTDAFLMKNEVFSIAIVAMVVSAIALRPLYPLLSSAGFILLHLGIMIYVLSDDQVVTTDQFMDHFYGGAVNSGIFIVRIIMLGIVGLFLAGIARWAQKIIHDAVDLEISNFEIKEQQAQLIHEGKMGAMSGFVAGVAHEVNNPLGVVKSSLETSGRCASKLSEELAASSDGSKVSRILQVLKDNSYVARQAVERIANLVNSMKDFARLDEAEVQLADLRTGLDTTLSLIEPEKKGNVEVVKKYGEIPQIECRPKELNQVFMTIIVNAFEAMGGQGTVHISTTTVDDHVTIEIVDTGPGIPDNKISDLFEIGFSASKGRMSMGLGLPMAYRIIKRHGGELSVHSALNEGTSFKISLPVNRLTVLG